VAPAGGREPGRALRALFSAARTISEEITPPLLEGDPSFNGRALFGFALLMHLANNT
jgi:hypothetical protein